MLTLTLNGCIRNKVEISLSESGTLIYTWMLDKEAADTYFKDRLPQKIKNAEITIQDHKAFYTQTETTQYSNYDELKTALEGLCLFGENGLNIFKEVYVNENRIVLVTNEKIAPKSTDGSTANITLDLIIKMPRKITKHTVGSVLEDGKSIHVNLENLSTSHIVDVSCSADHTIIIIISSIIALLGCCTIAFLVYRSQRKKAEAMPNIPIDIDNSI